MRTRGRPPSRESAGPGDSRTFKAVTVSKPGAGYTLVARAGTGTSAPSAPFTVYAAVKFGMTVSSGTTAQAGVAFTVTVTALDGLNRPDPTYTGTVRFTSTAAPLAVLPPDYTFLPSDNGTHTCTVTLNRAGVQTLTVADTLKPTVKKVASLTVAAAAVTGFQVTGPTAVRANVAYGYTVTAVDGYRNRVTGYRGTVQFTTANGTALLPGPYTFTALDKGRRVFSIKFQTTGPSQSLTATDQADPGLTGTRLDIMVM